MTHTLHSDIHDHGLADGCPECAHIAENPLSTLDERALHALVVRTLRDRFGGSSYTSGAAAAETPFGPHEPPRSNAEARAMAVVMTQLERAGKLAEVAPDCVETYLQERWHINVSFPDEKAVA